MNQTLARLKQTFVRVAAGYHDTDSGGPGDNWSSEAIAATVKPLIEAAWRLTELKSHGVAAWICFKVRFRTTVRRFQGKFGPEHGLVDREGDADVDNARSPSGNVPDEKGQSWGWKEAKVWLGRIFPSNRLPRLVVCLRICVEKASRLTRAILLEQGQPLMGVVAVWGSCTIQDGGTGLVPSWMKFGNIKCDKIMFSWWGVPVEFWVGVHFAMW